MQDDKFYTIDQAIGLLRNNKELIFEIRGSKEKCNGWYEHMLLICVCGIYGHYSLHFWTKPKEGVTPYKWTCQDYIPFSENVKWYISPLTKSDVQNSINEIGVR
ncbi:hypothetical protein FDB72_10525 [Clostridium botulinum]|nr:hypothetical protein [Clostridium botulinum]